MGLARCDSDVGKVSFAFDQSKFEELLLYVAERSKNDPNFGNTKLNKILFYIDFLAYGEFGRPVTGATYQRRPYGPVPREIVSVRSDLRASGDIDVVSVARFGYRQDRVIACRTADLSKFNAEEVELIDNVIAAMRGLNAVGASELSHREQGWQLARDGQTIPYPAVFLSNRPMTEDDIRRGQEIQRILDSQSA